MTHIHNTEPTIEPGTLELWRDWALPALLGVGSGFVAYGYLRRASAWGGWGDWIIGGICLAATLLFGYLVWDTRRPLLLADRQGVRLRLGREWLGIPWDNLDAIEYVPRKDFFHDGRLGLRPSEPEVAVRGVGTRGKRQIAWSRKFLATDLGVSLDYGARFRGAEDPIARLRQLMPHNVELRTLRSGHETPAAVTPAGRQKLPAQPAEADAGPAGEIAETAKAPATASEETGELAVAEATPASMVISSVVEQQGSNKVVSSIISQWQSRIRLPRSGQPESPASRNAPNNAPNNAPSVGSRIKHSRQLMRLSIASLASQSGIPAEVIAAIEADNFAVCGEEFYVRGQIQTLARLTGTDADPLLAIFEEHYAGQYTVSARSLNAEDVPRGRLNWSIMVAVSMALVLAWSVTRVMVDAVQSPDETQQDVPVLNGAAERGLVPLSISAAGGDARVVVKDARGDMVFSGHLPFGMTRAWQVKMPVKIKSSDGSVVVEIEGTNAEALGAMGEAASQTYGSAP
jgi:cytoskeleton protein RodZ